MHALNDKERVAVTGDVYTFRINDHQWGLCQVVRAFTFGPQHQKMTGRDEAGQPYVTLLFCREVFAQQPTADSLASCTVLYVNNAYHEDRETFINVPPRPDEGFIWLGNTLLLATVEKDYVAWGDWESHTSYVQQQHDWDNLPPACTAAFIEAKAQERWTELPGYLDPQGKKVRLPLANTDFDDSRYGETSAEFSLDSLQHFPLLFSLNLSREYPGLEALLAARTTISSLVLSGVSQPRLDLSQTSLTELHLDVSQLRELILPPTLSYLSISDQNGTTLQITCAGRGDGLYLLMGGDHPTFAIQGLESLTTLCCMGQQVDMTAMTRAFPELRGLILRTGKAQILSNFSQLGRLKQLVSLEFDNVYGFGASDVQATEELPQLEAIIAYSIPQDAATALQDKYGSSGVELSITLPRKAEWIRDNLHNPFLSWEDMGISSARVKKACALYKKAMQGLRKPVKNNRAQHVEAVVRDYITGFNALDAKRSFIGTTECEDIIQAIDNGWDEHCPDIDKQILDNLLEKVREF